MTHRTTDQIEIAGEVPSPARLRKLRTLIPMANAIIVDARTVWIIREDPSDDGTIDLRCVKMCAGRRRAIDKRMDALGVPIQPIRITDFPERTEGAARASGEFFVALESAVSALRAVNAAELATIPPRR